MPINLLNTSAHMQSLWTVQLCPAGRYLFKAWLGSEKGLSQKQYGGAKLPGCATGRRQGGMEAAAPERWAGVWPVGPKALAAKQVTEGLQGGCAGEDLGNSTPRIGVSW